jgi:hypothetical protein
MSEMEALLDALDESREQLLIAIEPLPDEALLAKGAFGEWSITDVLINLTAWEAELVTGFMRLDQKKPPVRLLETLADPEAYDRQRYVENQDRDLDQIFDDLQLVRVKTEDWLAGISERALTEKRKSLGGRSLAEVVSATTIAREQRVLPQVKAFAEKWLAEEEDSALDSIIPLTAVDMSLTGADDDDAD